LIIERPNYQDVARIDTTIGIIKKIIKYLPKHPKIIDIRYSHWRLLKTAPYFLISTPSIRRETTADNATAPAMVPNTMPTNALVLKADLGGMVITVTLVRTMSINKITIILRISTSYMNTWKKVRYDQSIVHLWMGSSHEWHMVWA
jgi:hypothetical protein